MKSTIVWFSCGAPSAVAAMLAVRNLENVWIVYCNTLKSEHSDNKRFLVDVVRWLRYPVIVLTSQKYSSVDEVFEKERFMSGPKGARCTVEMKKVPRFRFQDAEDLHIFGLAADEQRRIKEFEYHNPELNLKWILDENNLSTGECHEIISNAGIELPMMYRLGFKHNNCIGCVKSASVEYWNKVRLLFPEVFNRRVQQSRAIGCKLVKIKRTQRIFLDELPILENPGPITEDVSCGPQCHIDLEGDV